MPKNLTGLAFLKTSLTDLKIYRVDNRAFVKASQTLKILALPRFVYPRNLSMVRNTLLENTLSEIHFWKIHFQKYTFGKYTFKRIPFWKNSFEKYPLKIHL